MLEKSESHEALTLDDYAGKTVTLRVSDKGGNSFSGVLVSSDARGVIISYTTAKHGDHIRFYPWQRVEYLHLEHTPKEKRPAGFHVQG